MAFCVSCGIIVRAIGGPMAMMESSTTRAKAQIAASKIVAEFGLHPTGVKGSKFI
jgi:hypothetical protein